MSLETVRVPRDKPLIPNPGQGPFFTDRYKVLHRAIVAGTGSGKTHAGVYECCVWCITHPGIVGYIFEPTFRMVKKILIPKLQELLGRPIESNPLIDKFHRGDLRIDWWNGSTLWLGSLEDPESAEGPSVDFIHVDEARLIRHLKTAIMVVLRRLRGSRPGKYPVGSWWTTTPDSPGSQLHAFTEDPETKNPNLVVYRMSIWDNQMNLTDEYIAEQVQQHPGGFGERFLWGRFAQVAAGSLAFDYSKHVIHEQELEGELWYVDEHGTQVALVTAIRKMSYGHDFGWDAPATQIAIGWDGDGRTFALDEFYKSMAPERELIDNALDFEDMYGTGRWWCDPSEPRTIRKLRDGGVKRARGYSGRREDGLRELGSRLTLQGDGRYRLYVHKRCVNLISELQTYEAKEKKRDHAVDGLRYGIMGEKPGRPEITASRSRERAKRTY